MICDNISIFLALLCLFSSFHDQFLFKLSHFWSNSPYILTLGFTMRPAEPFFIIICGPRRQFSSQCGPCIVLSLRPLLYYLSLPLSLAPSLSLSLPLYFFSSTSLPLPISFSIAVPRSHSFFHQKFGLTCSSETDPQKIQKDYFRCQHL